MAAPTDPLASVARALWLTRAGMVAERVVRALWLPVSLALIAATLWAFGLQGKVPGDAALWVAGAFAVAIVATLGLGMWRFRWPARAEAIARLDRTLPGRPLAALTDQQAINGGDPASAALWTAHRGRMELRAAKARPIGPKPELAKRDRYALRLVALTAALVAVLFAVPGQQGALRGAGSAGAAIGPSWEGWIMPPAYTGRPGLYLNEIDRDGFEVPQGSRVVLRFYGPPGALQLEQSLDAGVQADDTGQALEFDARHSGRLAIDGPNGREWQITVAPDALPEISATGPMTRARGGVLEQEFTASDDYGVQAGEAEITLDLAGIDRRHGLSVDPEAREPLRLQLPMPMSGNRADVTEMLREDLSQHPWANLPVRLVLHATDAAGQTGSSPAEAVVLPGRRFFEPSAKALIEIRRDLLWSRDNARRAAGLMRAMLHRSDGAFLYDGAPVLIRGAVEFIESRLTTDDGFTPEARDQLASRLWELALLIEEGELANARERLQRARERLDEAMQNGADPAEVQELMDELRDATRDYMEMLAEQAEPADQGGDQRDQGGDQERQAVSQSQIQEMMDQIQQLMEEGRMDEAAALMAQLNALLDNLQMQRGEGGDPMPGGEAMEGLGDTLGDQQGLADETFQQLQDQFGQEAKPGQEGDNGQQGQQPGQQQGQQPGQEEAMRQLAERQRQLRERLREQQLNEQLPGEGTAEGEAGLQALEEADRAMEGAAQALEDGDMRGALERQAEALEALREGLREFRDATAADQREQQGVEGEADTAQGQGQGRDPLGREMGPNGENGQFGQGVPGLDPRERARELMDEIRRRSAERERPETERDYLNRLIEPY